MVWFSIALLFDMIPSVIVDIRSSRRLSSSSRLDRSYVEKGRVLFISGTAEIFVKLCAYLFPFTLDALGASVIPETGRLT